MLRSDKKCTKNDTRYLFCPKNIMYEKKRRRGYLIYSKNNDNNDPEK